MLMTLAPERRALMPDKSGDARYAQLGGCPARLRHLPFDPASLPGTTDGSLRTLRPHLGPGVPVAIVPQRDDRLALTTCANGSVVAATANADATSVLRRRIPSGIPGEIREKRGNNATLILVIPRLQLNFMFARADIDGRVSSPGEPGAQRF